MVQRRARARRRARHYHRGVLRPSSLPHALAVATAAARWRRWAASWSQPPSRPAPRRPPAAAAPAEDPAQPLVPRIRSITPDYVPDKGPIVIRGTVTNDSDQDVDGDQRRTASSATRPITTTAELTAAAETPVDADVGDRITGPGTFDSIASLVARADGDVQGQAAPARRSRCPRPASTGSASTRSATTATGARRRGRPRPHLPPLRPAGGARRRARGRRPGRSRARRRHPRTPTARVDRPDALGRAACAPAAAPHDRRPSAAGRRTASR